MLVEVERRLETKPLSGDEIVFAYFAGSLAALVADIGSVKSEALDIVAADPGWTDKSALKFIQLAEQNVLPGHLQAEIARRRRLATVV